MRTRTRQVLCWVEEGFDALDVVAFCQVLSEAGANWNWRAYRVEFASFAGGLVSSSAQLSVQTCTLDSCAEPEVVVIAGGPQHAAEPSSVDPCQRWASSEVDWVGLRNGIVPLLRTGRYERATVAASARLQSRLLALEPTLKFSSKPWHVDGKLWSTTSADATEAALALVQRHVGNTARRAVETSLGLVTTFPAISLNLGKPGGGSES